MGTLNNKNLNEFDYFKINKISVSGLSEKKNQEIKKKFKEISNLINNKTFIFNKESKENGDLYGSIKPKEICTLIMEESKAEVNPSQVILKDELNKLGLFQIDVNFHAEVKAKISIKIDKIKSK